MVTKLDSVNPDEVEIRLVLGSNGPDELNVLLTFGVRGVNEKVGKRFATLSVDLVVLRANLVDNRDREVLDPVLELLCVGRQNGIGVFGRRLVERAEEDDGGRGNSCSLNN